MVETIQEFKTQMETTQKELAALMNQRREIWHDAWKSKQITQTQIAEIFGVTRQTVINEIRKYEENKRNS
tara:strand:+ start:2679 stop:2888 length:210 start_codon:yes stop_codon:yes gene_type:complete